MKLIRKHIISFLLLMVGIITVFWYFNEVNVEAKSTVQTPQSLVLNFSDTEEPKSLLASLPKKPKATEAQLTYYAGLKKELTVLTDDFKGDYGLTYLDLATGQEVSIHGDQIFYGASTTKVPLVMMISDLVDGNKLSWNQQVKYDKKYYETGTGTLQGDLKDSYKLSDLAQLSITVSDNIAKNMLYSLLGGNEEGIKQIYSTYLDKTSKDGANAICSDDAARILEILFDKNAADGSYQNLINDMEHTIFHDRLETAVTSGHIAHKIGSYEAQVHDIGIFYNGHPYVLTVYTDQMKNAETAISQISDKVWQYQTDNYPEN